MIEKPQLDFGDAVKQAANNIFKFSGRARRSEYWWTMLFVYIIDVLITPVFGTLLHLAVIPLTVRRLHDTGRSGWWLLGLVAHYVMLFMLLVDYILAIITLVNDENGIVDFLIFHLSKYAILIFLLLLYRIILFVFLCQDSDKGPNKYGESPKYVEETTQP